MEDILEIFKGLTGIRAIGNYADYDPDIKHHNTIYFAEDEGKIYFNGNSYGGNTDSSLTEEEKDLLNNIYTKSEVNSLIDNIDLTPYETKTNAAATYQPKGNYLTQQDISNKADISAIPTKVSQLTNDSKFQTESQVDTRIQNLINSAPEALDTLGEIAAKLNANDDVHAALVSSIAEKATKTEVDALKTLTANYCFNGVAEYSSIDTCTKEGFYFIKEAADSTNGTNIYNLLLVFANTGASTTPIRQTYYRLTAPNTFSIIYRVKSNSSGWSVWYNCKLDGADIKDTSISHTKLIEGSGSGLDAD